MKISILTFQGFNEIDSFVAFRMLTWLSREKWDIKICCPEVEITSAGGLTIQAQSMLEDSFTSDAVIFGSGKFTRHIIKDENLMSRIKLDPKKQVIASQCSGALILAKLGLLDNVPACTDAYTKPLLQKAGVEVLDQPFYAHNKVATAGGCLASAYLTAWVIAILGSVETASQALSYVAPVGEKNEFVKNALQHIMP